VIGELGVADEAFAERMYHALWHGIVVLMAVILAANVTCAGRAAANDRILISAPSSPAVVGIGESAKDFVYLNEFIEYYFSTRGGSEPQVMNIASALKKTGTRIILCTPAQAKQAGLKIDAGATTDDGFCLASTEDDEGGALICCVGNNTQGIKYGLYRLIYEADYADKALSLPTPLRIRVNPFIKNRVLIQSPCAWIL
jgi:hypothetical protein